MAFTITQTPNAINKYLRDIACVTMHLGELKALQQKIFKYCNSGVDIDFRLWLGDNVSSDIQLVLQFVESRDLSEF